MLIRVVLLFLITCTYSFSQELHFHSEIEKEIFNTYKEDSTQIDFFKSLSAIDSVISNQQIVNFEQKVNNFISTLPQKELKANKELHNTL